MIVPKPALGLSVRCPINRSGSAGGPTKARGQVSQIRPHRESLTDPRLQLGTNDLAGDVELSRIGSKTRNNRALGGVHTLVITRLFISVHVALGVEGKRSVGDVVVLMALDMSEPRGSAKST